MPVANYIVVGVDGTGSQRWRYEGGSNSFVHRFVNDVDTLGHFKKYYNGPNDTGTLTDRIVDAAYSWLCEKLVEIGALRIESRTVHAGHYAASRPIVLPANGLPASTKIVLVGHSRGAWATMRIARRLMSVGVPVQFMGLYDAVDRTITNGFGFGQDPVYNVAWTYHAMRHSGAGSRPTFGNTGLRSADSRRWHVVPAHFWTSHGGIGGDGDPTGPAGITGDYTCRSAAEYPMSGVSPEQLARCRTESIAADGFIRLGARAHGVTFYRN